MQLIKKIKPLFVVLALYLFWKLTPLSTIPATFIKKEGFVNRYELFFFPLLTLLTHLMQKWLTRVSLLKCICVAVLAGHVTSIISIAGTWVLESDKISDLVWWNNSFGFFDTLFFYLAIPFPTLGWFLTPLAFVSLKVGTNKVTQ